jgi:hypothetical protein
MPKEFQALRKGKNMSRLNDLLSKSTPEKATPIEADELAELTGKLYPQDLYEIITDNNGLANAVWIIQRRDNPSLTIDDVKKQITVENNGDLQWEMLYIFSTHTREAIEDMRNNQGKTEGIFTTKEYKDFPDVIKQVNEFMKSNKNAKFTANIICEKESVEEPKNESKVEN